MILVTGGAGYIGSHTCVELLNAGYDVVIVDNFYNSEPEVVDSILAITGKKVVCVNIDVCDKVKLSMVFDNYPIDGVIHFAGYKAVGESVAKPLMYYRNNLDSTMTLSEVMEEHGVKRLLFSSSATVYRADNQMPLTEDAVLGCSNPYGWTKLMIEQMLEDISAADKAWSIVLLRYFNPIGAHESGLIGEKPRGIPNNLMPYITLVASRKLQRLHVFGNDYSTPDGTGVRDYMHVVDLAKGHVDALKFVEKNRGIEAINLSTGTGYSVLDVIKVFEKVNSIKIPFEIVDRRPGDIAECYANPDKAKKLLSWKAEKGIEQMCKDAWNFEMHHKL